MDSLLNDLIARGVLKTPEIIQAFRQVDRRDFLPREIVEEAERNEPLPIGFGQTNSQPETVAIMLELLRPEVGNTVLDVGSGSGWTTALLCRIVGASGLVTGVERFPILARFGKENVEKYGYSWGNIVIGDGSKGLPDKAPFDKILVSAAAHSVPQALKEQLNIGGTLVIPTVAGAIHVLKKRSEHDYDEEIHDGFLFVPLIES